MGYFTTHVLDTANGRPGAGIRIRLWHIGEDGHRLLKDTITNTDGRTDQPLLAEATFDAGHYELMFAVADYFAIHDRSHAGQFLNDVVIRFVVNAPDEHYHVPLLVSPYGYSTYRGS